MPKIRIFAFPRILATLACLSFNALAAQAVAETSAPPVCGVGGAFGISFGEKISSTQVPLRTFFFGRGCYQVSPPTPHRYFDTYAACVSEFDGEVFQIQALKVSTTPFLKAHHL